MKKLILMLSIGLAVSLSLSLCQHKSYAEGITVGNDIINLDRDPNDPAE